MSFDYSHRERCGSCERCRRFAFLYFPMAFFYSKLHFVHKNYPKRRETIRKGRPRKHLEGGKNTKHAKTTLHCWKSIRNCLSTGVRSQNTNTRATKMTRDDGTNRFQPVAATRLENLTVFLSPIRLMSRSALAPCRLWIGEHVFGDNKTISLPCFVSSIRTAARHGWF